MEDFIGTFQRIYSLFYKKKERTLIFPAYSFGRQTSVGIIASSQREFFSYILLTFLKLITERRQIFFCLSDVDLSRLQ